MPPQLFLLKWCRLLFCREFAAHDAVLLLDGVVSRSGVGSERDAAGLPIMVGAIAVAMVITVRDSLLRARDENDILEALMRYKFPGGGAQGEGKYAVVGKARVEQLLIAATAISQGRDPGLASSLGGLGVAGGGRPIQQQQQQLHSLEGVVEGPATSWRPSPRQAARL